MKFTHSKCEYNRYCRFKFAFQCIKCF